MDIRVLGVLEVRVGAGPPVQLGGAKQRSVLAMLALSANSVLTIDALAEGVWGEDVPPRYVQNVQVYVSTLRRLLEPTRTAAMPSRILARGAGYELVLGPDELDLSRFRSKVGEGVRAIETAQPSKAVGALRAALDEWRGEPVTDLAFQPFATAMTRGLADERWSAFERLIEAELAAGRGAELVPELEGAVSVQPLRETLWEHLATALYRAGRQADALAACRRARERLLEELGLDPGPGLRTVEQQVLEHAPSLMARRGATIRASRIPVPLNSLVGRDQLVDSVIEVLRSARLVVLVGPGGVGKTRVALAVAARAADRSVAFVDLSNERDAGRVLAAVASAVDASERIDDVADRIDGDETLLIIDNFEHVIDAAHVVESLVALAPASRVLVTSRSRLGINGERAIEVAPLSTDEPGLDSAATRLFCERAVDVHPTLDLAAYQSEIATVCRNLDGMPLAIELAASRLAVLSPADLARGIGAALRERSTRGGGRRHSSMRSAIEWSTDLLNAGERRLFTALAICEAAIDIASVRALGVAIGTSAAACEDALEALVAASLVRVSETDDGRRFSLLSTIRAVANGMLDSETEAHIRAAHADWFCARAIAGSSGDDYSAIALVTSAADMLDTAAAVRWLADRGHADRAATAVASLYNNAVGEGGHFSVIRLLAEHVSAAEPLSEPNWARLQVISGGMSYVMSDLDSAARQLSSIERLDSDDFVFRARGSMWQAVLAADLGEHAQAAAFATAAREAAAAAGTRRLIGLGWSASAYVAIAAGDPVRALECARHRLEIEHPGTVGRANGLVEAGFALLELGRLDEALQHAQAGLSESLRTGIDQPRGEALRCLAWCSLLLDDPATAAECLGGVFDIFHHDDTLVDRVIEGVLAGAIVMALVDRLEVARDIWRSGQALLRDRGMTLGNFSSRLRALADSIGVSAEGLDEVTSAAPDIAELVVEVRRRLGDVTMPATRESPASSEDRS